MVIKLLTKKNIRILFLFLILFGVGIVINSIIYLEYKKELYKISNNLIVYTIAKHPDMEEEFIKFLINNEITEDLLSKYGLENFEHIEYLIGDFNFKNTVFKYNLFYLIMCFFIVAIVIFKHKFYVNKETDNLIKYMNHVLKDDYSLDIRDYKEGNFSLIKDNIYKIVVKLKEQKEIEQKEKIYLKDFLSDISHQIRTPLTSMYVINDILLKEQNEQKRREFLNKNQKELERIEWLITSLLKMSLLDSESVVLKKEEIKIEELIKKSLNSIIIPIELKEIKVDIKGDKNLTHQLDFEWTAEAILNFLKNAYEHTPIGGAINIYYYDNPLYLIIKISDNGSGIEKEELPHIFKRFYKSKTSQNGIGIGLNMAKNIIEKQNGEIIVRSILSRGTTFEIRFYKKII